MATLTFFGRLADAWGAFEETIALPDDARTTHALIEWLERERGLDGVLSAPEIRLAINDEIVRGDAALGANDRIAFLPPVGGG